MMILSRAVLLSLLLGFSTFTPAAQPLPVTVSLLPQRLFVDRIGGQQVQTTVLVPPGKNPANYEPSPKQMETVAASRLVFRIGVPFENAWLPRLAQLAPGAKVVDLRDGLNLRPVDLPPGATPHAGGAPDPHVWLAPPLVMRMADRIRDELIALRPEARVEFEANHARFIADLKALDSDIRNRLADKKVRNFMVYHPSWGYFADAYGLRQMPVEAGWKEPGPRTLQMVIEGARQSGVRVVFVQPQFSQKEAQTIAQAIEGEVVAVDPLAPDYIDNLRRVADIFARNLQ
jgi:zinc transport system substrate-binding protein